MRTYRHLTLAALALVALTGATVGSSEAARTERAPGGGRTNVAAVPVGATDAVDLSDPAARGGPTSPPDARRRDAVNPRSSNRGLSTAASHTAALPSRRPLAERIDDVEEAEGAGTSASLTSYISYSVGYTQTSPRIYVLFWGNWTTGGDPYGVANYLVRFYQGVGGSAWNNTQTQYGYSCGAGAIGCSTGVRIQNLTGQYRGYAYDTTAVPLHPTLAQMEAEAQKAANYWGDRSVNAQYIIALPTGHRDQRSIDKSFCAWHNYTWSSGSPISFTAMPYLSDMGTTCGKNKVNAGTAGLLDGVSILAGHEYVESMTDPFLNAWLDSDNNENADKCLQWQYPGYFRNVTFTSGTFAVQPNWSNYAYQTTGNGCMFWS